MCVPRIVLMTHDHRLRLINDFNLSSRDPIVTLIIKSGSLPNFGAGEALCEAGYLVNKAGR